MTSPIAAVELLDAAGEIPVALGALLVAPGRPGMTWLWVSFTVVFMGARALTLGLRARGDGWLTLGGAQPSRRA